MKLGQLVNSKNALEKIAKGNLPIGIAWELKLFINKVNPELISFESIRSEKVKQYGELDEKENLWRVKDENIDSFSKDMNELVDREINITSPKISVKDLIDFKDKDGNGFSMTVEELEILNWLIIN